MLLLLVARAPDVTRASGFRSKLASAFPARSGTHDQDDGYTFVGLNGGSGTTQSRRVWAASDRKLITNLPFAEMRASVSSTLEDVELCRIAHGYSGFHEISGSSIHAAAIWSTTDRHYCTWNVKHLRASNFSARRRASTMGCQERLDKAVAVIKDAAESEQAAISPQRQGLPRQVWHTR